MKQKKKDWKLFLKYMKKNPETLLGIAEQHPGVGAFLSSVHERQYGTVNATACDFKATQGGGWDPPRGPTGIKSMFSLKSQLSSAAGARP